MRIKLFCVDARQAKSAIVLKTRAAAAFRPFSSEVITFSDYSGFIDMAKALDESLKNCDLVTVFASLESYAETKKLLIRALHLKTEHRFDVYDLAGGALECYDLLSPESSLHTELPVGAVLFVPENGLYPGFCAQSNNQYIMFLPFDDEISPGLLRGKVSAFLDEIAGAAGTDGKKAGHKHSDICRILADAGAQVAIARTPAADFVCSYGGRIDGFHRYFHLCGETEARGKQSPKDYILKLAIYAARDLSCPYGIAVSNIFTLKTGGKKELVVYFAVAGRKLACRGSLSASEDEDVDAFFMRSVDELFSLLKKRLFDENPILKRM